MATATDILDEAMNATFDPRTTFFGQVNVDIWACVLIKDEGKRPFDPNQHTAEQKRIAIQFQIDPLPGGRANFSLKRDLIAESKEWTQIVKPSLVAIGQDLRAIKSRWVEVELVANGTYEKKLANGTTETKQKSTLKFVKVFGSMEECQAAADAFYAHTEDSERPAAQSAPSTPPANSGSERDTALRFLPAMWKASKHDVASFETMLSNNPMAHRHFRIDSPEVLTIIGGN